MTQLSPVLPTLCCFAQELRGVEGIMMTYKVRWPLSLVLSKKNLTKYQLLFRHIFFAKHIERRLSMLWQDHQVWV
ncbi:unnamed protein product [Choristocarpus tenellus]